MAFNLLAVVSNLIAMASSLIAVASNLIAMGSILRAMACNQRAQGDWNMSFSCVLIADAQASVTQSCKNSVGRGVRKLYYTTYANI